MDIYVMEKGYIKEWGFSEHESAPSELRTAKLRAEIDRYTRTHTALSP